MSLFAANLVLGLLLVALGAMLLRGGAGIAAAVRAFPRSPVATAVCFGAAAVWFLYVVWHMPMADFGEYRKPLFVGFAAVAVLSVRYAPDFLAVRGLAGLMLLAAWPLLMAGFMDYRPQVYPLKVVVYLGILLGIWLGAAPYRMRDGIAWMQARDGRTRLVGGGLSAAGALLCTMAFLS